MHAVQQRGALLEFRVAEAEGQPAALLQRHIDTGRTGQRAGQFRPELGGCAGPMRIGRHAGAFALHPHQAEIAARGTEREVALVEQRNRRALRRGAPGDRAAYQAATDDDQVVSHERKVALA